MHLTAALCSLLASSAVQGTEPPDLTSLFRSPVDLPTGRLTVSLVTETHAVSGPDRESSEEYARSAGCDSLIPTGSASRGEFAFLARLPVEADRYAERAEWTFSAEGFSGSTILETFDPVVIANVNCIEGECSRWDIVEGTASELVRYTSTDPLESMTGGLYLMLREFSSLSTLLEHAGDWSRADDGSWSSSVLLDETAGRALVDPLGGRFLVPLNGVHELPGRVELTARPAGNDLALTVEWIDCRGGLLTRSELRWSGDSSPFPGRVEERNYVPGTDYLHTRRTVSTLWSDETIAKNRVRPPSNGQLVVDRRFGTPVQYHMDAEAGIPSDREIVQQIELRASRLAAMGVERHKKADVELLTAVEFGEDAGDADDPAEERTSFSREWARLWWVWTPFSLLGLTITALGLRNARAERSGRA